MLYVNNTPIQIDFYDTIDLIKRKIAILLQTTPNYLYLSNEIPSDLKELETEDVRLEGVSLLDLVKNLDNTYFADFYQKNSKFFSDIPEKALKLWIIYNQELEELNKFDDFTLFDTIKEELIENNFISDPAEFQHIFNIREQEKEKILKEIKLNINLLNSATKKYKELEKLPKQSLSELKSNRLKTELGISSNFSLMELFNKLKVSKYVRFISHKNYYKILSDFIPYKSWYSSPEDKILLYVYNLENDNDIETNIQNQKEYAFNIVEIIQKENKLFLIIDRKEEKKNVSADVFLDKRLNSCFPFEFISENELDRNLVFYVPNFWMNGFIFLDLILNDDLVSYFLSTDESRKSTKKLSKYNQPWIHVYFQDLNSNLTASISVNVQETIDDLMIDNPGLFEIGSWFLQVQIQSKNLHDAEKFQYIFSKLLSVYVEKHQELFRIYKKYIPDIETTEPEITLSKNFNIRERLAPELFTDGYSRMCEKQKMPEIIDKSEVKEYEEKGIQVMKFPRDKKDDRILTLPSDGINQHYYICPTHPFIYPGLQDNVLKNNDTFPYAPCCYKNDQTNNPKYLKYYEDIDVDRQKRNQDTIKTDKILDPGHVGLLPQTLNKILSIFDSTKNFRRYGVYRSTSNLISAFLLGSVQEYNNLSLEKQIEETDKMRTKMSSKLYSILNKQSFPSHTLKSISKILTDKTEYLSPKYFCNALRLLKGYNFITLSKEGFIVPESIEGLYQQEISSKKWILIYENKGSETDNAKYPQCEVVVNVIDNSISKFYFDESKDIFIQNLLSVYKSYTETYICNNLLVPKNYYKIPEVKFVSQIYDTNGKCRHLNTQYKDITFTILTDPLPPYLIPKAKDDKYILIDYKTIYSLDILKDVKFYIENNLCLEVIGFSPLFNNLEISIPVVPFVVEESSFVFTLRHRGVYSSGSLLEIFNKNKKMARYLAEYCIWSYSHYIKKNKIQELNDTTLSNFSENNTIIIPEYKYDFTITEKMDWSSPFFSNSKIVFSSEKLKNRCLYAVKIFTIRHSQQFLDYYLKENMNILFEDLSDFTKNSNEIIIYGVDTLRNWINSYNDKNDLVSYPLINKRTPFFIKNENISSKILIVQSVRTLEEANLTCQTILSKNYNPTIILDIYDTIIENVKDRFDDDKKEIDKDENEREKEKELKNLIFKSELEQLSENVSKYPVYAFKNENVKSLNKKRFEKVGIFVMENSNIVYYFVGADLFDTC